MSVAFRRESDEEHLEPKFERPLPPGPNLVTARGLALIASRIVELDEALRASDPSDEVGTAELKRDLRYWRARQASARLTPAAPGDEAAFGSRIAYRTADGADATIDIVGQDEADPGAGRIAYSAPLARALIGTGAGDRIAFGGGLEIVAVSPIPE